MLVHRYSVWALGFTVLLPLSAFGGDETARALDQDEVFLKKHHVEPDTASLLEFFRTRSLTDDQRKQLEIHVRRLGSSTFVEREQATRLLTDLGTPSLPYLEKAARSRDREVVRRAERIMETIKEGPGPALATAAIRVLSRRQPAEAVGVLLHYVPFADDDTVEEQLLEALLVRTAAPRWEAAPLALGQDIVPTAVLMGSFPSQPDPALVAALHDPVPARRAAAAYVLTRVWDNGVSTAASALLADGDPKVRLRTAQGVLARRDKAAVPVLIALLADTPVEISFQAEDLLHRIADSRRFALARDSNPAPTSDGSDDPLYRSISERGLAALGPGADVSQVQRSYRDAWNAWWDKNSAGVDLSQVESGVEILGLTLIVQMDTKKVWECGRDGRPRWSIEDLQGPIDAQVLPGGRVLIAEFQGHLVSERDMNGRILWSKSVRNPVVCQRLPNGNTFIASYATLQEVGPDGKVVYSHSPSGGTPIYGAQKLRNGRIIYVTLQGKLEEIESATGRVTKSIQMDTNNCYSVEAVPGGRFLVTGYQQNRVAEVDATGKTVWQCAVPGAYHATRLPNGNTLVSSHQSRKVVEVNHQGEIVWQITTEGSVWRVHRR
jgi:hypothetical protein